MSLKVIMQEAKFERVQTGLWSFDRAVGFRGAYGVPIPALIELYGQEHTGKSTFALYLASRLDPKCEVVYCDVEGTMTEDYAHSVAAHSGFDGTLRFIDSVEKVRGKEVHRLHEDMIEETLDRMMEPGVRAGILDSIGMYLPAPEKAKKVGKRSVGQKAKTIAQVSRELAFILRETAVAQDSKLFIYVNHTHPNIGGHGFYTPGGNTKQAAANLRLWIRRVENDIPEGTGNFVAEVAVHKLKIGGAAAWRKGLVYFIPGYGVSPEMTRLHDGIDQGVIQTAGGWYKTKWVDDKTGEVEWKSVGRLRELAEKAEEPDEHRRVWNQVDRALELVEA